ncbi:MAG: cytochrome C oxidase subunit IV family protein [Gemmatimonadales bacterium]
MNAGNVSFRTYWGIWSVLLVLTVVMMIVEAVDLSPATTILILVAAMLTKASLIVAWFMHLRFERPALMWSVVAGTLFTAAFLYFLLIPDARDILYMVS